MSDPHAAPAPRKKVSPLIWILIVLVGLFMLICVSVMAGGFFMFQKAKQITEGGASGQALSITRMMTAANPDLEVVSVDEGKNLITIKEKSTGRVVTINFNDAQSGKIAFTGPDGESAVIGGADTSQLPAWVPKYPGAAAQATYAAQSGDSAGGTVQFTTSDNAAAVIKFYDDTLRKGGFTIQSTVTVPGSNMITAVKGEQSVAVTASGAGSETAVNVIYGSKK